MVGCGAVTQKKSAPAYAKAAGSRLVAVASRRASSSQDYAMRHGIEHVFADPEELIRSPDVDAVYIATPPSSHLALALRVAEAGKPCCVEKPLAMSHGEAVRIVRAFEAARQPLFVAYYRRSLPRFGQVMNWLARGAIGQVRHVHWSLARTPTAADLSGELGWRTDPEQAPGGYFEDLACHGLNLFDFLLGPIDQAGGVHRNQQGLYEVPDAVAGTWSHAGGATGSGFWNFAAFERSDEVQIIGSGGRIGFSVFEEAPLVLETNSTTETIEIGNPDPIQLHHVENMILHLSGAALHPSLGDSAARTEWVADQILRDLRR
jgi:predicted dehydrogenase